VNLDERHRDLMARVVDEKHALALVINRGPAQPAADKVGVKDAPAVFAVGNRLQPDLLLQGDRFADEFIFQRAQLGGR
jgi:hypothetical protein